MQAARNYFLLLISLVVWCNVADCLTCYNCRDCGNSMEEHKQCAAKGSPSRFGHSLRFSPKCYTSTMQPSGEIIKGCGYVETVGCVVTKLGNDEPFKICHCDTDYCNKAAGTSNFSMLLFGLSFLISALLLNHR